MSSDAYKIPDTLPANEAAFLTDNSKEVRQKLDARCVGACLRNNTKGEPVVLLALRVEPGQKCQLGTDPTPADVGGQVVVTIKYLTDGTFERTFGTLRICGFDMTRARKAYAQDKDALSMAQQFRAAGASEAEVDKALSFLALQRGDHAATGLGEKVVRFNTKDEEFPAGSGKFTRKVDWIEAIPAPVAVSEIANLVKNFGSAMAPGRPKGGAGAQPGGNGSGGATGPSSPAPGPKDSVDF